MKGKKQKTNDGRGPRDGVKVRQVGRFAFNCFLEGVHSVFMLVLHLTLQVLVDFVKGYFFKFGFNVTAKQRLFQVLQRHLLAVISSVF